MNTAMAIIGRHFSESDTYRFWSKVAFSGFDECWPWKPPSKSPAGYGIFGFNGRHLRAPRVAFALANGVAPANYFVMHTCDNPSCCNPNHLIVGTAQENSTDMVTKGRARAGIVDPSRRFDIGTWRAKNLPFQGSSHPAAKLNETDVRRIKLVLANGIKGVDCAAAFGCSTHTVSNINRGKQWKHV